MGNPLARAGGRGGVHVHFALHVPAERYDAAVVHLRGQGLEVEELVGSLNGVC